MAGGGVVLVGAPRLRLYYIYSPILSFPKKEMFSKNVFQKRKCFLKMFSKKGNVLAIVITIGNVLVIVMGGGA